MGDDFVSEAAARRFLFVTGKGGVGKTTLTAALALALARRGKRVLVALCGAHERLSAILGTAPIGHPISELRPNVWATKIAPELAMEEYGQLVIKVKAVSRAVFDNRYTNGFFRAVPGLFEWAMLGKAWYHTTEKHDDGGHRFDVVLFDAPSTGHGLDMLRVPKVILDIVPPGVLRRDAEAAVALLRDPKRAGVVVVSRPEDMPVTEALEMIEALEGELAMPVARVVVNAMLDPLFDPEAREALLADPATMELPSDGDPARTAVAMAARRAARERVQARALARVREAGKAPVLVLPHLLDQAGTAEAAGLLADALSG